MSAREEIDAHVARGITPGVAFPDEIDTLAENLYSDDEEDGFDGAADSDDGEEEKKAAVNINDI